ncbi:MAG: S1 RNA-binding domain-containing protein [Candidatus Azambacteria bacterium]|nr:S1 RNA-binding domain-containing protein [Candidatus Azambacteria bacterium]
MQNVIVGQNLVQNPHIKALMEEALKIGAAKIPKVGDVIAGTVANKESLTLYADFGVLGMGIVYGREFRAASDIIRKMNIGDPISGKVVDLENERGFLELSLKDAGYTLAWDDLIKKKDTGEIIEVEIKEANKGGLMTEVNNIPAFMPVSQLATKHYPRVDGGDKSKILIELQKFAGQKFKVKIIDVNQDDGKLIVSEKEAQDDDLKKILSVYTVGDIVNGEVSGVVNFGVFVKFTPSEEAIGAGANELEGLVHISELDWQLIENPADTFKVGDAVSAQIISLDSDKISLSIKALKKDPWEGAEEKFKKGDMVKGTIVKLNPFGAFVRVDGDIQGLCHISEFGTDEEMRKTIESGKEYDFNVQSISSKDHRMALGFGKIKQPAKEAVTAPEKEEEKDVEKKA